MPTFPVRRLGAFGIVTDMSPSDVEDPAVFTAGVNVRYRNGKVSRGPMFRTVANLDFDPGHCLSIPATASGAEQVVMVASDFSKVKRLNGALLEDLTPSGLSGTGETKPITSCILGGVSYVNCESDSPISLGPADSAYQPLPNWPAGFRCKAMRAYKDQLVALGVTKGGQLYPTMVKWSDITGYGSVPGDWSTDSTTNSAGENIVNEMKHAIVDGLALRNSFVLYCTNSVWQMDYVGGTLIYDFAQLFEDRGIINPNCVVQAGGQHFVFDKTDIYVHDGVTPRSIADQRVREFVFNALDTARTYLCFVAHDARLSEIRFCYPASDDFVGYQNPTTGCNRAAVYNYANDTWTFDDLPNVTAGCRSSLMSGKSWETDQEATWDETQGLFLTTEGDENQHALYVGRADASQSLTRSRLYGCDLLNGGLLTFPIEPETVKPAFGQRTGLDLDSMGKNLTQYTHLQAIWPQVFIEHPEDFSWQFGANDLVTVEPAWSDPVAFDPAVESKIDINEAGKYLAWRFKCGGTGDFSLSGFDVLLVVRGRR